MDRPDKSGVWQLTKDDMSLIGIVKLEENEVQLPTSESPYRLSDLVAVGGYDWTYLRDKYRQEKTEE